MEGSTSRITSSTGARRWETCDKRLSIVLLTEGG